MSPDNVREDVSGSEPMRPGLFLTWPKAVYLLLVVVVVSGLLTLGGVTWFMRSQFETLAVISDLQDEPSFNKLFQVIELAHTRFVDEDKASVDRLLEGAIKGAVDALDDRYSMYYDRSNYASLRRHVEGEYTGIGTTVTSVDGYVTIMAPFRGTPAATTRFDGSSPTDPVGLLPGDRIKEVDGNNIVGMPLEDAVEMIVGPEGSEVVLTVLRDVHPEPLTFRITRAHIVVPVVEVEMLPDGIGYIHLLQFTDHTLEQVQGAINNLKLAGMRGLVLDLRNNGGGLLSSVEAVSGVLVPSGPLVHIHARDRAPETLYSAGPGLDIPMVVLVNRGTASASEILAGAIRDHGVADLIGMKTFGKGSVQNVWDLDEDTGVKVTIARFFTPSGMSIEDEEGLAPDHEVELPPEAELGDMDTDAQLQEAYRIVRELTGQ